MSKMKHLTLAKCNNMTDFKTQLIKLKNEIMNQKIIIENYFVIKAINSLDQRYETWIIYFVQQARDNQNDKLLFYETIFENLQQKKHRQK